MRYYQIRECDIANGKGVGVALFVQGCHFHCYNCFNPDTWDFNSGKEWTSDIKEKFLKLIDRPYIKRVSILGGEPLADENLDDIYDLIHEIRLSFDNTKTIWLYSGYTWEQIQNDSKRKSVVSMVDVLVDGRYIDELRDATLQFRGSSNQRLIAVDKTIKNGNIILYNPGGIKNE